MGPVQKFAMNHGWKKLTSGCYLKRTMIIERRGRKWFLLVDVEKSNRRRKNALFHFDVVHGPYALMYDALVKAGDRPY